MRVSIWRSAKDQQGSRGRDPLVLGDFFAFSKK